MLLKATHQKDKQWHFNQYDKGNSGPKTSGANHYDHETHEKMFAWHVPDEGKKAQLRKDAHEQVTNGSTKGHVASHALLQTLDDFKERLEEAEGDKETTDQILSEMHDWLMYVHAQHDQHGLHKDSEFRRAYQDAHTFHSIKMGEHESSQDDRDD